MAKRRQKFDISVANEQARHPVDRVELVKAATLVLNDSPFHSAAISLAFVDDATMHKLNRRHLNHDWPTDVLSFVLHEHDGHLEGEVIVSADTAAAAAADEGWSPAAEQLLYVIHGMLHLVGYRDKTAAEAREMRLAEARFLREFGYELGGDRNDRGTAESGGDEKSFHHGAQRR